MHIIKQHVYIRCYSARHCPEPESINRNMPLFKAVKKQF